jgi:nicotinate-nucleotide adenylyltransferase
VSPAVAPPCDAARNAQRLGVLGGSFDPPHLGHLHAARRAREAFALEHVLFVPAARPPHKPGRILASGAERLEMLALLLADEPWTSVWGVELARKGPSYTVDTMRELRARVSPGTQLHLILGEDNLAGFARWKEAEALVRLAQPIVVHRSGADLVAALTAPDMLALSQFVRTRIALGVLASAPLDASSTELRAALARGAPAGALPPRLAAFVEARGLYRA